MPQAPRPADDAAPSARDSSDDAPAPSENPAEAVPAAQQGVEEGQRKTTEPRVFTVVRKADESGVSGTGRVLDGCVFHNGQVVVCWRGDINSEKSGYASLAIYPCWEAFQRVHIDSHPSNETEVIFGHGAELMARLVNRAADYDGEASDGPPSE